MAAIGKNKQNPIKICKLLIRFRTGNINFNGCINDTNMLEHFNYHNIRKNLTSVIH